MKEGLADGSRVGARSRSRWDGSLVTGSSVGCCVGMLLGRLVVGRTDGCPVGSLRG